MVTKSQPKTFVLVSRGRGNNATHATTEKDHQPQHVAIAANGEWHATNISRSIAFALNVAETTAPH